MQQDVARWVVGVATLGLVSLVCSPAPAAPPKEMGTVAFAQTSPPVPVAAEASGSSGNPVPGWPATLPFVVLLGLIAALPLNPRTEHWWDRNRNKLITALMLGTITLAYYFFRPYGVEYEAGDASHVSKPGIQTALHVVDHAILAEYVPFIVLLFSLYVISGGIQLTGDLVARPRTNVAFLGVGAVLANLIGTTGASMLLIRPLLQTNRERRHKTHTVIFFIFLVSNIGGSLLPIGDPPLFLGYLKGVDFFWTLRLWPQWAMCVVSLLVLYYIWDRHAYRREETLVDIVRDLAHVEPLRLRGKWNFALLLGVVAAVALLAPGKTLLGLTIPSFLREGVQLMLVAVSLAVTPQGLRKAVGFNYHAIAEVAALFIGIFLTMQVPVEILRAKGAALGLTDAWQFFWATGLLSSVLDNAPTYVVFFETAGSLTHTPGPGVLAMQHGFIRQDLLAAISLGAVFMGANSYIGNGPNFMVKSIAERSGVRMPSFFGYLAWSLILLALFLVLTVLGCLSIGHS